MAFKNNRYFNICSGVQHSQQHALYCTALCLALLPFVSSLVIGKYNCNKLQMFLTYFYVWFLVFVFFYLGILCFGIVLWIVSPSVYSCVFPTSVQFYRPLPFGGNAISVNSIISYHVTKEHHAWRLLPFLLIITSFDHVLSPGVFKIQQISHTDSQAIQTEGEANNSFHVS